MDAPKKFGGILHHSCSLLTHSKKPMDKDVSVQHLWMLFNRQENVCTGMLKTLGTLWNLTTLWNFFPLQWGIRQGQKRSKILLSQSQTQARHTLNIHHEVSLGQLVNQEISLPSPTSQCKREIMLVTFLSNQTPNLSKVGTCLCTFRNPTPDSVHYLNACLIQLHWESPILSP